MNTTTTPAPSAIDQQRAIWREMQTLAEHVPNGRDFERRADFDAAYDAHEARMAELEQALEALNDAARAERRSRLVSVTL